MITPQDKSLYEQVLSSGLLSRLSKNRLAHIIKYCSGERKKRYPQHNSTKRYGNLRRDYTEEEYERFIKHVDHPKARLAFQSEHYGGLRVGEVVEIKLENINWLKREMIVKTEKTGLIDTVVICDIWFDLLRDWVNQHYIAIQHHNGYIFWSDNPSMKRDHISDNWLRVYGAKCREEAGLNQVYGMSYEKQGRRSRRLFRLVPNHSHRHSFGTGLWEATGDMMLVKEGLRHTSIKSTSIYIHVDPVRVHQAVNLLFAKNLPQEMKVEK